MLCELGRINASVVVANLTPPRQVTFPTHDVCGEEKMPAETDQSIHSGDAKVTVGKIFYLNRKYTECDDWGRSRHLIPSAAFFRYFSK